MNWNFHKIKAQQLIKRIKYFKEIGLCFFFFFNLFFFFWILEWVLKEITNKRSSNLSTKWVDQWSIVGYAHKKYKDTIFQWNKIEPTKKIVRNCTLVNGQHTTLQSQAWLLKWMGLFGQNGSVKKQLKGPYVQWGWQQQHFISFPSFWFYFLFFIFIFFLYNESNKIPKSNTIN